MNKKILIAAGILLLVLLLIAGLVLAFAKKSAAPGTPSSPSFPQSSGTTIPSGTPTQTITTANGNGLIVKDFIHNGETISDTQNPGSYLLAGQLGYCLPSTRCSAATSTDFNIGYNETNQAFTVALLTEPLGQARLNAEQFLEDRLGLTKDELCKLNYYVGTTYWVNERYAAGNLGFSSCPGATKLP
ncbi:MAG: hypothetical protein JWO84_120 [Parcubacteria group bacterium]|nr:hypothetical protein [Parcubacteria group bacterium]